MGPEAVIQALRKLEERLKGVERDTFRTWKSIATDPELATTGVKLGARRHGVDTAAFRAARELTGAAEALIKDLVREAVERVMRPPRNMLHRIIRDFRRAPPSIAPCTVRASISGAELEELGEMEQLTDLGLPARVPPDLNTLLPRDYKQKTVMVVVDPPAPGNDAAVDFEGATLLCPAVKDVLLTNDGERDAFVLADILSWHVPFRLLNSDGESLDDEGDVVEAVGVLRYRFPANCCPVWPLLVRDEPNGGKSITCFHATDADDTVVHTVTVLRLTTGERWAVDLNGDRFDRLGLPLLSRLPLSTGVPAGCTKVAEHWAPTRATVFYDDDE